MDWEKYSYVISSKRRKDIVSLLRTGPKTPKEIAKSTGLQLSHVSNLISGLVNNGISVCLTPEGLKGRLYALTDVGKDICTELK